MSDQNEPEEELEYEGVHVWAVPLSQADYEETNALWARDPQAPRFREWFDRAREHGCTRVIWRLEDEPGEEPYHTIGFIERQRTADASDETAG